MIYFLIILLATTLCLAGCEKPYEIAKEEHKRDQDCYMMDNTGRIIPVKCGTQEESLSKREQLIQECDEAIKYAETSIRGNPNIAIAKCIRAGLEDKQ